MSFSIPITGCIAEILKPLLFKFSNFGQFIFPAQDPDPAITASPTSALTRDGPFNPAWILRLIVSPVHGTGHGKILGANGLKRISFFVFIKGNGEFLVGRSQEGEQTSSRLWGPSL